MKGKTTVDFHHESDHIETVPIGRDENRKILGHLVLGNDATKYNVTLERHLRKLMIDEVINVEVVSVLDLDEERGERRKSALPTENKPEFAKKIS